MSAHRHSEAVRTVSTSERLREVCSLLESRYGKPSRKHLPLDNKLDPLDELIFIILSLKTSEHGFERVFDALKEAFPLWDLVLKSPQEKLETILKPAGLSRQKAPRIRAILESLIRREGKASLDFLPTMSLSEAEDYLLSLPGVGEKTARCVLMYSLGAKAFPVDTHVLRIFKRLGLVPADLNRKKAHNIIQDMVPKQIRYSLHVNLVIHGRSNCTTYSPNCVVCPITHLCLSYPDGPFPGVTP